MGLNRRNFIRRAIASGALLALPAQRAMSVAEKLAIEASERAHPAWLAIYADLLR
jgi:Ni,Fe-hydrogenase I small subunit